MLGHYPEKLLVEWTDLSTLLYVFLSLIYILSVSFIKILSYQDMNTLKTVVKQVGTNIRMQKHTQIHAHPPLTHTHVYMIGFFQSLCTKYTQKHLPALGL